MTSASPQTIGILGGNPETGALVQVANAMGLRTVVLDPYPHSPAKRHATVAARSTSPISMRWIG